MAPWTKGAGLLLLGLSACNQSSGMQVAGVVAGLDPTGISGTALGLAQMVQPEPEPQMNAGYDLSQIGVSLEAVAAGRTERPKFNNPMKGMMNDMAARQAASAARTVIGGVMSGGAGLIAAAPSLAMQAATTGMVMGKMAQADAQIEESMAKADAARAANRIVPDEDRPAEAQALLSIADAPNGKSATWRNPETGASGKVTIGAANSEAGFTCRIVDQEWKAGGKTRKGGTAICEQNGVWYDLS